MISKVLLKASAGISFHFCRPSPLPWDMIQNSSSSLGVGTAAVMKEADIWQVTKGCLAAERPYTSIMT